MQKLAVVLLCVAIAAQILFVAATRGGRPALDPDLIDHVNQRRGRGELEWEAGRNPRFVDISYEDAQGMLGLHVPETDALSPIVVSDDEFSTSVAIPTSFDARTQWPGCIQGILDQGQCGSCWAFASAGPLSDRFCISTGGAVHYMLSPQALVSCDTTDLGCNGGYLDRAWAYLTATGIPTSTCYPYTATQSACAPTCADGSAKVYHKAGSWGRVSSTVTTIQNEIMTKGPVTATMAVYNDFFSYKSGVYKQASNTLAGYHAVKLIGWGVSGSTKYWIAQNQWGTGWGMSGYFYIRRGNNEVGIEAGVYSGLPKVSTA